MEVKKSLRADLEGKKSTGWLMGLVMTLAAMFVAFEWTQTDRKVIEMEPVFEASFEEDMIPITQQKEVMAPPPAAAPKIAEILNVVDNETELFLNWLDMFGEKNGIKFTVTISADLSAATDGMQKYL